MDGQTTILSRLRSQQDSCADNWQPTPGLKGAITGALNSVCGGDADRHRILALLFPGAQGSKRLTDRQWWALYQWTGVHKDDLAGWAYEPKFAIEAMVLLRNEDKKDV